ncbi:MAG: GNAT family N-acetyltransferase [Promethearchaeota archaeon]
MSLDFAKLSFQIAKKDDIPQLTRIMVSAYESLSLKYLKRKYGPPGYDAKHTHIDWMIHGPYYKIFYDGDIVGGFILDHHLDILFLNYFFIDVLFQHKGIGTRVLGFLDTLSTHCIEANTPEWAIQNQHFYTKNGFRQVDTYFDDVLGFTLYFYHKYK